MHCQAFSGGFSPDAWAVAHHVRPHLASNASLRTRGGQLFLCAGAGLVAVLAAWTNDVDPVPAVRV